MSAGHTSSPLSSAGGGEGRTLSFRHSFPASLNPFTEDPMLTARIEQWTAQVEARGKAEGRLLAILELAEAGDLPRSTAELRLRHLAEQGLVSQEMIEEAIGRLPRGTSAD